MGNTCGSSLRWTSDRGSCPPARNFLLWILLPALLLGLATRSACADPLLQITKDTLLGGATGLILGGTLTLVVDEEDRSEVVRWGVVIGTFGGFSFGVWRAMRGDEEDLFGTVHAPRMTPTGLVGQAPAPLLSWAVQRSARAEMDPAARVRENRDSAGGFRVKIPLIRFDW